MANDSLINETLTHSASAAYTNVVSGILIILGGFIIGKIISIILVKLVSFFEFNNNPRLNENLRLLVDGLTIGIYIASTVWGLIVIGIFNILLQALATILGLAVLGTLILWSVELIPNIYAGYILRKRGFGKNKKTVKFDELNGKVVLCGIINSKIVRTNGDIFFMQNRALNDRVKSA